MIKSNSNQINDRMYNDTERRKYQRVEKPIIIRFRVRPNNRQEMASSEWDMVGVNDLSVGGLFFNSSKNIQDGTVLDLKIGFSTSSSPVQCTGMVTRVKKQPDTSIFGIAAAFMNIAESEKELINRFINQTIPSHLALTS
ncbi:MAG: PilZ domain-containing protein [Candidatus Scalindua sp.]